MESLKTEKDESIKKLDVASQYILKLITDVEGCVAKLQTIQIKMKEAHEFLQEHAARKQPYISTDYYKSLIEALKEQGEAGNREQIKQL